MSKRLKRGEVGKKLTTIGLDVDYQSILVRAGNYAQMPVRQVDVLGFDQLEVAQIGYTLGVGAVRLSVLPESINGDTLHIVRINGPEEDAIIRQLARCEVFGNNGAARIVCSGAVRICQEVRQQNDTTSAKVANQLAGPSTRPDKKPYFAKQ